MRNIFVIHGPNLNLLGEREPDIYGDLTLPDINDKITQACRHLDVDLQFFQSNHEGHIIDMIHQVRKKSDGIVLNAGAFTHYAYALYDALRSVSVPAVEVHLTDVSKREPFRSVSVIRPACVAHFMGRGWMSYVDGVTFLAHL